MANTTQIPIDLAKMAAQPSVIRMSAVDPHATLTAPIGPAPKTAPIMAPADATALPRMSSAPPVVNGPASLPGILARTQDQLMSLQQKDDDPYGSADNHPGFLGKFLHGLNVATGGVNRRHFQEDNLENQIAANEGLQSKLGLENAESQNDLANVPYKQAQTNNLNNPLPDIVPTAKGYQGIDKRSLKATPIEGSQGQPLMPYLKPVPFQHLTVTGPDGKPMLALLDPQTGVAYDSQTHEPITHLQPFEKPSSEPHITKMVGAEPHIFSSTDGGHTYTVDQGIAPPSYAQAILPTKTTTFIGPNGLPEEYQWNPATQSYDKAIGISASNAYGHEAAQAGAVDRAGQDLIQEVENNKQYIGNPEAIIKSAILNTPWADPKTARLRSQIASFAALQPSMHGFRGTDALKQFKKIIGGIPNNPDALVAAIQGIQATAGAINPGLQHSSPENAGKQRSNAGQTETQTYMGHTYKKGADGQWHLQP